MSKPTDGPPAVRRAAVLAAILAGFIGPTWGAEAPQASQARVELLPPIMVERAELQSQDPLEPLREYSRFAATRALDTLDSPGNAKSQSDNGATREQPEEIVIQDNSFLIEEAYNQESGIVQHIFNWVRGWDEDHGHSRTFDFAFTQEWPICSQRHQFSYVIPASRFFEHPEGESSFEADGLGDILLNYRYQLWDGQDGLPWFAPRFSLILPSGDEDRGLGTGEVGYQINLPISQELGDWAFHFNAGLTVTPNVSAGVDPALAFGGRTLNGYNLGASAIYKLCPDLHLMLESVALWDEALTELGSEDHTFEMLLSPGFRWAPYTHDDTQWVLGAALPVGLSTDAADVSLFFYMSFEHRFKETPEN